MKNYYALALSRFAVSGLAWWELKDFGHSQTTCPYDWKQRRPRSGRLHEGVFAVGAGDA